LRGGLIPQAGHARGNLSRASGLGHLHLQHLLPTA
jgi:hypothetical protein